VTEWRYGADRKASQALDLPSIRGASLASTDVTRNGIQIEEIGTQDQAQDRSAVGKDEK
jgi:hypothetical protein